MKHKIANTSRQLKNLCTDFMSGDFFGLAAEMSFYLLSCFLPMIIFVFTVASSISQNYSDVMLRALGALPDKLAKLLIKMLISRTRSSAVIAITGAFSLFNLASFITVIEKALVRFYHLDRPRGLFKGYSLAVFFAFFVCISIIASFALIVFGGVIEVYLLQKFQILSPLLPIWNTSRHILILVFIAFVISALFKVLPTIKLKIWQVLPGAAITTIAWYITSVLFALYVNNFSQYEIVYGSLAGFACLIMWIYITGIVFLSGAKINAMMYHYHKKKAKKKLAESDNRETDDK